MRKLSNPLNTADSWRNSVASLFLEPLNSPIAESALPPYLFLIAVSVKLEIELV
jgi:hypothetical protein